MAGAPHPPIGPREHRPPPAMMPPLARLLSTRSGLGATLPSDAASRATPCAPPTPHRQQAGFRTWPSGCRTGSTRRKGPVACRQAMANSGMETLDVEKRSMPVPVTTSPMRDMPPAASSKGSATSRRRHPALACEPPAGREVSPAASSAAQLAGLCRRTRRPATSCATPRGARRRERHDRRSPGPVRRPIPSRCHLRFPSKGAAESS